MNLLSHFYLDRDLVNSYFTVGAATPDLLSIYNSNVRAKAVHLRKMDEETADKINPAFLDGLKRHFFADGVFHTSPLFQKETRRISELLVEFFPHTTVPRKFFIAHILLELMLDKVLIDLHPGLLDSYYGHFQSLQPFRVIRSSTELAVGANLPNYENYMTNFLRKKFLFHYAEYDHIAFVLRRILRRVRISETGFLDTDAFTELMATYESELLPVHEGFFDEIRAAGEE